MVNWKAADATDRLFGSLIAAHPGLKVRRIPLQLSQISRSAEHWLNVLCYLSYLPYNPEGSLSIVALLSVSIPFHLQSSLANTVACFDHKLTTSSSTTAPWLLCTAAAQRMMLSKVVFATTERLPKSSSLRPLPAASRLFLVLLGVTERTVPHQEPLERLEVPGTASLRLLDQLPVAAENEA